MGVFALVSIQLMRLMRVWRPFSATCSRPCHLVYIVWPSGEHLSRRDSFSIYPLSSSSTRTLWTKFGIFPRESGQPHQDNEKCSPEIVAFSILSSARCAIALLGLEQWTSVGQISFGNRRTRHGKSAKMLVLPFLIISFAVLDIGEQQSGLKPLDFEFKWTESIWGKHVWLCAQLICILPPIAIRCNAYSLCECVCARNKIVCVPCGIDAAPTASPIIYICALSLIWTSSVFSLVRLLFFERPDQKLGHPVLRPFDTPFSLIRFLSAWSQIWRAPRIVSVSVGVCVCARAPRKLSSSIASKLC